MGNLVQQARNAVPVLGGAAMLGITRSRAVPRAKKFMAPGLFSGLPVGLK